MTDEDRSSNVDFEDCKACAEFDGSGICSNCENDGRPCDVCDDTGRCTYCEGTGRVRVEPDPELIAEIEAHGPLVVPGDQS